MQKFQSVSFLLIVAAAVIYSHPNDIRSHLNDVEADPDMEKYLREALENFRNQMKEGIPAINMPVLDPLNLRNLDINVDENLATMALKIQQITVRDFSTFVVPYINADLETFFLNLKLSIPTVRANGNYTLNGKIMKIFPLTGNGSFSINATKAEIAGTSKLDAVDDTLQANKLEMDISWDKLDLYLENFLGGGGFSNVLQRMLPNIGKNIFESFKPKIMTLMNNAIKDALNKELRKPEVKKIIKGIKPPS